MARSITPGPSTYARLRKDIQTTLADGQSRAQKAVERERVVTYWAVGDLLVKFLDANPPDYGSQVMKKLAADLEIGERLLYDFVQFRRNVPELHSSAILSWTHHRKLLAVADPRARGRLLADAERNRWSVADLSVQIRGVTQRGRRERRPAQETPAPLRAKRGELWLYPLLEKPGVGLVLDQGFRTFTVAPSGLPPAATPGDVLRSVRHQDTYRLEPWDKPRRAWSYVATVGEIIDGDTMWVTLDTGFGNFVDQKLRLRGIDTPELKTADGRRARDFVVNAVGGDNGTTPPLVISTTKVDKYDRYLADVFYAPNGVTDPEVIVSKGAYLNRQLLTEGLAVPYVGR